MGCALLDRNRHLTPWRVGDCLENLTRNLHYDPVFTLTRLQ